MSETLSYTIGNLCAVRNTAKNQVGETCYIIILSPEEDENFQCIVSKNASVKDSDKKKNNCVIISQKDMSEGYLEKDLEFTVNKISYIKKDQLAKHLGSIKQNKLNQLLRMIIKFFGTAYYDIIHKQNKMNFIAGVSRVNYAGRVFDEREIQNLLDSSLDFWLTEGRFSEQFAEKIADFLGVENVILVNSGSSANLIAFAALTSQKLGERRIKPGDEVISVAAGFPATISPIIQYGLIPVFVDVTLPTYNIDIDMMEKALSEKTRCIFIAHTLGNPFNIDAVMRFAEKNNLWVIEDNCDAFGSKYDGKYTGTLGDISTISFYPAHHITTGEGGAVITNNEELAKIIKSFRDWGRDCYCAGGENNTCGKRFTQQFGALPYGYDHKYVYSELGYNMKMTDMQAAIGAAQMDKLELFCSIRRKNFMKYHSVFNKYKDYFILPEPTEKADPAWFSFIVSLKNSSTFARDDIVKYFNDKNIETRNLFAGNIVRQPGFINTKFRIADNLNTTDYIMNNTFFLGTYPGLADEMIDYVASCLDDFMKKFAKV